MCRLGSRAQSLDEGPVTLAVSCLFEAFDRSHIAQGTSCLWWTKIQEKRGPSEVDPHRVPHWAAIHIKHVSSVEVKDTCRRSSSRAISAPPRSLSSNCADKFIVSPRARWRWCARICEDILPMKFIVGGGCAVYYVNITSVCI